MRSPDGKVTAAPEDGEGLGEKEGEEEEEEEKEKEREEEKEALPSHRSNRGRA